MIRVPYCHPVQPFVCRELVLHRQTVWIVVPDLMFNANTVLVVEKPRGGGWVPVWPARHSADHQVSHFCVRNLFVSSRPTGVNFKRKALDCTNVALKLLARKVIAIPRQTKNKFLAFDPKREELCNPYRTTEELKQRGWFEAKNTTRCMTSR